MSDIDRPIMKDPGGQLETQIIADYKQTHKGDPDQVHRNAVQYASERRALHDCRSRFIRIITSGK